MINKKFARLACIIQELLFFNPIFSSQYNNFIINHSNTILLDTDHAITKNQNLRNAPEDDLKFVQTHLPSIENYLTLVSNDIAYKNQKFFDDIMSSIQSKQYNIMSDVQIMFFDKLVVSLSSEKTNNLIRILKILDYYRFSIDSDKISKLLFYISNAIAIIFKNIYYLDKYYQHSDVIDYKNTILQLKMIKKTIKECPDYNDTINAIEDDIKAYQKIAQHDDKDIIYYYNIGEYMCYEMYLHYLIQSCINPQEPSNITAEAKQQKIYSKANIVALKCCSFVNSFYKNLYDRTNGLIASCTTVVID